MQGGAEALRAVVQGEQAGVLRDPRQGRPVGGLAEQVDADQRARAQLAGALYLRNAGLQMGAVDLEGARIDIDKDGRGAEQHRHFSGGGVSEGRQEDGVTEADAFRHQSDLQSVGAGADADAVGGAAEGGEARFQLSDFGAEDELAMRQYRRQPRLQRRSDTGLLGRQIEKRDRRVIRGVHNDRISPPRWKPREPAR